MLHCHCVWIRYDKQLSDNAWASTNTPDGVCLSPSERALLFIADSVSNLSHRCAIYLSHWCAIYLSHNVPFIFHTMCHLSFISMCHSSFTSMCHLSFRHVFCKGRRWQERHCGMSLVTCGIFLVNCGLSLVNCGMSLTEEKNKLTTWPGNGLRCLNDIKRFVGETVPCLVPSSSMLGSPSQPSFAGLLAPLYLSSQQAPVYERCSHENDRHAYR